MAEGGVLNGSSPLQGLDLLIIQILVIIFVCRVLGFFLKFLRQPTVIAEILGGIILGPSVLGHIPGFQATLFPEENKEHPNSVLSLVAQLGLVFYLFLVGLELDVSIMRARFKESFLISIAGIIVPFACSFGPAKLMFDLYMTDSAFSFGVFALFIGVAMSITAFPVLARILGDLHLFSTPVGIQTLSAAAVDDAAAWALLALVIGIVHSTNSLNALYIVMMTIAFAAIMLGAVRPLLARLFEHGVDSDGNVSEWVVIAVLGLILLASLITDIIGVHQIFGAFITGLAIPRRHGFDIMLTEKIEDLVVILFLPLFFASSGLKTDIGLLNDGTAWGLTVLVLVTACIGKVVGCSAAALLLKMSTRESLSIGVLMNTKGLVELIVLNVGLDTQVINAEVFAIMVVMAVATTFITTPLVSVIYPPSFYRKAAEVDDDMDGADDSLEQLVARHIKPLVCLPGLRFLPTMMNVMKMLVTNNAAEKAHVHTVRVIETSTRSSSIMKVTHQASAMKDDPIAGVLNTFGAMNNMEVFSHISLTHIEEMAADISEIADANKLNFIIIPWQHPKDIHVPLDSGKANQSNHTVVKSLLKSWPKSVAVILDRGVATPDEHQAYEMMVPFFGGPDDREALMLAFRMAHHQNTKIHIVHIVIEDKNSADGTPEVVVDDVEADKLEDDRILKMATAQHDYTGKPASGIVVEYEAIKTTSPAAFTPLLERLHSRNYSMVIFGMLGPSWVTAPPFRSEHESAQKTVGSAILHHLSAATYGGSSAAENNLHANQSTIRSIRSFFNGKRGSAIAEELNQQTFPMAGVSSSADHLVENVSSTTSDGELSVRAALGETGKAIWNSHIKVSLIAVRKAKLAAH